MRNYRITEHAKLQLRMDTINLQNRTQFSNPNTDPTNTNFGKSTSQNSSINRFYQIQARLQF